MNELTSLNKRKSDLQFKLLEFQKKIFEIENELIDIDKVVANFSDNIILANLELSEQQQMVVDANEDNILVLACPGSGKTHSLISKYVKLITTTDIKPEELLLITFTKKSGMEMLNRLTKIVPHKLPYHVGSLHGLCYKVLQQQNDINYTVLDCNDMTDILFNIINSDISLQSLNSHDIDLISSKIQFIIDQASTNYPFDMKQTLKKNNLDKYLKHFKQIYSKYQQKKKKENLIDFNDLMILFCKFLNEPKSLEFRDKIKYVYFDEYQDVNPIQNYILSKFAEKSKIMVVGDDAQAIYSFRGSSVNYILNFNTTNQQFNKLNAKYILSENYRSTPYIVNFCQDIISNNTNQYNKSVTSKHSSMGTKPCIFKFRSADEQYKWIVNDILKKNKEGVNFSEIVILARKNTLLNDIELHLLGNSIPTVKHLGLSLLDKPHIKDFMAFIIILINPKSSLHWKRIISLHPQYNIKKANDLLDNCAVNCITPMIGLIQHIAFEKNKDKNYTGLTELYNSILHLKKLHKDIDKARYIVKYLQTLWKESTDNIITDIYNLLNYLNSSSLEEFINDLYLNQDVETNLENVVFLTTAHAAKGLEWEHVYIIDMNSKEFPAIRPKYYLDELEEMDEERRLFYVAASRAKKYLTITYHENLHPNNTIMISPLLREINPEHYIGHTMINKFSPSFIISRDISDYLKFIGYSKISTQLQTIKNSKTCTNTIFEIPTNIMSIKYKTIISNFMDHLIAKMIQINFPNKIKKFDLQKSNNFPHKIYLEYIDPQTDWRNILEHIFYISTYKFYKDSNLALYQDFMISQERFNYYIDIEKTICKIINTLNPTTIYSHYHVSCDPVRAEIDILCDDTIIEIKTCFNNEIVTIPNLTESLLHAYLLNKKHNINKIILYNPINGQVNQINLTNNNIKFDLVKFKQTIYNSK